MFYTRADTPARVRAGLTLSSDQSTVRFTDYAHYGFDGFIKYMRLRLFRGERLTVTQSYTTLSLFLEPLQVRLQLAIMLLLRAISLPLTSALVASSSMTAPLTSRAGPLSQLKRFRRLVPSLRPLDRTQHSWPDVAAVAVEECRRAWIVPAPSRRWCPSWSRSR